MIDCGNSIMETPYAGEGMRRATKRLSQAAIEVQAIWRDKKHSSCCCSSTLSMECNFIDQQGMNPEIENAQRLSEEYQIAWQRVADEDNKFVKQLKVGGGVIDEIVAHAIEIAATDDLESKIEE